MAREDLERRLAAILSADVVGYSRLMGEDEPGTLAALKAHRSELIDPRIAERHGRIVKLMGDGALVEFASIVDAVECAVDIQRGMAERNLDVAAERRIAFRIGINLGDVIIEGDDIYGDGVNVAARLQALADPGGVCVSRTVFNHVRNKVALAFEDMGQHALKNIEEPVSAFRVSVDARASAAPRQAPVSGTLEFTLPERPSVAILPFQNLSGDPEQDFLAEGLRLGILSTLVQLSGLFLISSRAVNHYRDRDLPAAQVGGEVGVRYVLEGAVQSAGQRVRATLQLTDARRGQVIWAERYDRVLDDVFKLQDEVSSEVITALDVRLLNRENGRIWASQLTDPEARDYYYRGISHLYMSTGADNAAARRMFEELYRVRPDLQHGPNIIALTHWLDAFFGWSEAPARSAELAGEWARKAVGYEHNDGISYAVLGHLELLKGRHADALANCRKAIELRSSCPLAHGLLASVQDYCGDPQRAVKNARKALDLSRIYPIWLINVLAAAYRDCGEVGRSIPAASEAVRLAPEQNDARIILCSDYTLGDAHDQASRLAREILDLDPGFHLSGYAKTQPYKDGATLERLIGALRQAGLPD